MKQTAKLLILAMGIGIPAVTLGQISQGISKEKDTVKLSKDSIIHMIRVKDSLLNLARRDSLALVHLIQTVEQQRDSLNDVVILLESDRIQDSTRRMDHYFRNREQNRHNKTSLKEAIPDIEEDSVRAVIDDLVGIVYDDTAYTPKPAMLRKSFDRLVGHLSNDSVHFRIINARQDTVPFTLKRGRIDSTAFYVMNSNMDSARIFIRSLDKHAVYMWVGDDLMLQQLLRKDDTPWNIPIYWHGPNKYRATSRPLPVQPPKPWNLGAEFNLMINQAAYSHWSKGGNSNIQFTTDVKGRANYAHGNIKWNNSCWFIYGVQKNELMDLRKSQDKIEINSALSHKAFKNFDYSTGFNFLTQGFRGYNYPNDSVPVSTFMAPAYLNTNIGLVYTPVKDLKITMSPVSGKFTMILDTVLIDQTKFGLKAGQRVRAELGAQVYLEHRTMLFKNISMYNRVILYSNYIYHPEKVDVDWLLNLDLKVNKYISTTIRTNMVYDDDMVIPLYEVRDGVKVKVGEGKRLQFMETLAVGFKYYL